LLKISISTGTKRGGERDEQGAHRVEGGDAHVCVRELHEPEKQLADCREGIGIIELLVSPQRKAYAPLRHRMNDLGARVWTL
jgi:hypothetical protein